jgi:5-methylcytosine-specific restriction endonuclease McrA
MQKRTTKQKEYNEYVFFQMFGKQGFGNYIPSNMYRLIYENRQLIKYLSDLIPNSRAELAEAKIKYNRYINLQKTLAKHLPFRETMKVGHGPIFDEVQVLKREKSTRVREYKECINYLTRFIPYKEYKEAKKVYARYLELQDQLNNIFGYDCIIKLEIDPRSGENEYERRMNRLRILTLLECDSCSICGFPLQKMLDVHHIVPLYLGGTNAIENFTGICCNCHRTVHRAIAERKLSYEVKEYYGIEPEMLQRLENIVSKGIKEAGIRVTA